MSAGGTQHSGWGNAGHNELTGSYGRRLGYNGKYYGAKVVATTTTGSFEGYGAFMLGASSDSATTKIFVAGGATIAGSEFAVEKIYDIAPEKVQSTGGNIYVFKRQQ
tara:strand:- start:1877 stop:2197 length:321 start_codon:yes stop_codon:yes gene_type:complete